MKTRVSDIGLIDLCYDFVQVIHVNVYPYCC